MTLPNVISLIRILLIPIFVYCYFYLPKEYYFFSAIILAISGITDVLDGYIARKFNLSSKLGKILDPISDKLTQLALCICLSIRYNNLVFLLLIFLIKEFGMLIGGISMVKKGIDIPASKWYGKISTFLFYVLTLIIMLIPNISDIWLNFYSIIIITVSIFALVMYGIKYYKILNKKRDSSKEKINDL